MTNREVLRSFVRALRYIGPFRNRFLVKFGFLFIGFIAMLFLPFPLRILIDQVILDIPFAEQASRFPTFVQPFVALLEGASRGEILVAVLIAQASLLVLVGAWGISGKEKTEANGGLNNGWDIATKTENEANSGFSEIGGVLGWLDFRWTIKTTQLLNHHYRSQLFSRIQALPMTAFDDERIGDAVYRLMYDTTAIANTCYKILFTPVAAPIHILMIVAVMSETYGSNTPMVYAGLGMLLVAGTLTFPASILIRRFASRSRTTGATTTSSIEEGMSNMVVVQSLGGEKREHARFSRDSEASFRQFRYRQLAIYAAILAGVAAGSFLVIFFFRYVSEGIIEGRFSPGDYAVLASYFGVIAGSSIDIGTIWIDLQTEATGLQRVSELLDAPAETDRPDAITLPRIQRGVAVEAVDFAYEPGTPTLRGISFEAKVGEVTAFVGPAGAGKTTAVHLIPRFHVPDSGSVRVDGVDIAGVAMNTLREQIAFVFQETVLFDTTIEQNIRMGRPEASETEIRHAARIAGADEFIARLPEGYQTRLGHAGGKLSVGQRQRLSIARALVREAPILILDEPTSALDPETEQRLTEALREASRDRVVIVIAHRLSTVRDADQILFMEEGRIIEKGNHAELIRNPSGAYRHFVELQTRGVA
ncbi:MAG: ABC transporter ATP-binding protein [bacterium]|nr:ABC transporter ATP-binding protein [bacterium]